MGFINGFQCFSILDYYRLVWISGRFGGHKTSFAYAAAEQFLKRGYRLITNNKSIWADRLEDVSLMPDGKLKAVVILDEGGLEFSANKQIQLMAAYARKMDVIYMIPSFYPPARQAQVVTIQPLFSFKSAGIPLIIYRWRVKLAAFEDKGHFGWFDPSYIYGIYSSADPGERGSKIVSWLIEKTQEYRRYHGVEDDDVPEMAEVTEADILSDAVAGISEAAADFASVSFRKRKRR